MLVSPLRKLYNLYKLRKVQKLGSFGLEKIQEKKLRNLVRHAYSNVEYYRGLFDKMGLKPREIKNLSDLSKIPITSREQLQKLPKNKVVGKDIKLSECINLKTSGSSGQPLNIFIDRKEFQLRRLYRFFVYFENGYGITDKLFHIIMRSKNKDDLNRCFGFSHKNYISVLENNNEALIKLFMEVKPEIIRGFSSSVVAFAREVAKRNIKKTNSRLIFCTAELLSQKDKEFIESALQAEVIDYYSANECGVIAWECREHKGYHIQSDSVIVEIIKKDGQKAQEGEEGEIIITSLNSYTMPFIRYRLGDRGVTSDERCPCGRGFPLIKLISGRSNDYIVLPCGRTISPYVIMTAMDRIHEVTKYQFVQQNINQILIKIVKNKLLSSEVIDKIIRNYQSIMGNKMNIRVDLVNDIPKNNTDKLRVVRSDVHIK